MAVFDFKSYKAFLKDVTALRGMKSAIASAARCQPAYISRVLGDLAELSLEQAQSISVRLGLTDDETDYFLTLVQHDRAGNPPLKSYFKKKQADILSRQTSVKERMKAESGMTLEDQATYYQTWYFAAIHILVTIPEFQTKNAISERLGLSGSLVSTALAFLVSCGLVTESRGVYRPGKTRIHLGGDSPLVTQHHIHWRIRAIDSLETSSSEKNTHYASVVSLSREDVDKIKRLLLSSMDTFNSTVAASHEEGLYCLNVDFFEV